MTAEITQGDNGVVFELIIKDGKNIVDITNSSVDVLIKHKDRGVIKSAEITDGINGECNITLISDDIVFDGVYTFQATVNYANRKKFTSSQQKFVVNKKIGYVPAISGEGNIVSVNGKSGEVTLTAEDIGALPLSTSIPSKISDLINDNDFVTTDIVENKAKEAEDNAKNASVPVTDKGIAGGIAILDDNGHVLDGNGSVISSETNAKSILLEDGRNIEESTKEIKTQIEEISTKLNDTVSDIDAGTFTDSLGENIIDGGNFV